MKIERYALGGDGDEKRVYPKAMKHDGG